jgi:hypothetical protein
MKKISNYSKSIADKAVLLGSEPFRRLSYKARMSPSFIIIGVQKAGTTSLYNYLIQHPAIVPAVEKELHFFDLCYHKGLNWYRSRFPQQRAGLITGEASPYYISHPLAASRIAKDFPSVKLILLLRNPVERTISHYKHNIRQDSKRGAIQIEPLSLKDAIEAENTRIQADLEDLSAGNPPTRKIQMRYAGRAHMKYSYLTRGRYVEQIEAWLKYFPREQLLVLKSEDLYSDPQMMTDQVISFLGLPRFELKNSRAHNQTNKAGIDPTLRGELQTYFKPYNEKLYDLLGVDFGWN